MNGWYQVPTRPPQPQQNNYGRIWFAVALAGFALASLVALNWSFLKTSFNVAAKTTAVMNNVRTSILDKYDAEQVSVQHRVNVGFKGAILSIQVLNLDEQKDSDFKSSMHYAKEIAKVAYDSLEEKDSYKRYEVVMIQQSGIGITLSKTNSFSFHSSQLSGDEQTQ